MSVSISVMLHRGQPVCSVYDMFDCVVVTQAVVVIQAVRHTF